MLTYININLSISTSPVSDVPYFCQKCKIMRKFFLAILTVFMAACESENEGYHISGTVENATDGQNIIVLELNESNTQAFPVDTAIVKDGKFELDLPEKDKPTISFLTVEGTRGNLVYISDNTPISFKLYTDSIYSSEITGGADNEVLSTYLQNSKEMSKKIGDSRNAMRDAMLRRDSTTVWELQAFQEQMFEQDKEEKLELIESNPNSVVSAMILQDMLKSSAYSTSELIALFEGLSPEVKDVPLAQNVKASLDKMSKTAIGSIAPNFSAPTPEGNQLALNEVLGKVTLVDFWAAWCKPCRVENPNIVEVYNQYHDKGFNIVQVSLDRPGQKDRWIEAIKQDNIGQWNHVSNLMFWQDPIAVDYGIRAIPAAFLLDEEGRIIAKDLRGEALGQKVGEVLNAE